MCQPKKDDPTDSEFLFAGRVARQTPKKSPLASGLKEKRESISHDQTPLLV